MDEFPIEHRTDIAEDIEQSLPSRHRHQDRFLAIMKGFGDAVQELETLVYNYLVSTSFQLATGPQLDKWGQLVQEPRGPFDDKTYRELIQTRALINVSGHTIDEIIEIYRRSTSAQKVYYYDHFPAGFRVEALRAEFMSDARKGRVRRHMDLATNGGVDYTLVETRLGDLRFGTNSLNASMSRTLN